MGYGLIDGYIAVLFRRRFKYLCKLSKYENYFIHTNVDLCVRL